MRRRDFITGIAGSAAAWPLAAHAQQGERVRRIGVLMNFAESAATGQRFVAAFRQRLQELGWVDGRNAQIDVRWAAADFGRYRTYAAELVALAPGAILAATTEAVVALKQSTQAVPIVFVSVVDPVGSGLVASLRRPRGNTTGFMLYEYSLSGKWLELLKEIAPRVTRVAVLRDSAIAAGIGQFAAIQTVAPIGMELSTIDVRNAGEVEPAVAAFAHDPGGGLIVTASAFASNHSQTIAMLAARHHLPAVYPLRFLVEAGGLISYGPELVEPYRRAAGYVDRILKGENPADLPVQAPTRYELVINLKSAKALGLEVPATVLARADEVIE
jgi:putative ABC transport system substrate-binding protein